MTTIVVFSAVRVNILTAEVIYKSVIFHILCEFLNKVTNSIFRHLIPLKNGSILIHNVHRDISAECIGNLLFVCFWLVKPRYFRTKTFQNNWAPFYFRTCWNLGTFFHWTKTLKVKVSISVIRCPIISASSFTKISMSN